MVRLSVAPTEIKVRKNISSDIIGRQFYWVIEVFVTNVLQVEFLYLPALDCKVDNDCSDVNGCAVIFRFHFRKIEIMAYT